MNKTELIDAIAQEAELTKKDAEKALNAFISSVTNSLSKEEDIVIPNFGSFKTVQRAEREGRNPQTGKPIKIPSRKVVKFTAGKILKESVDK